MAGTASWLSHDTRGNTAATGFIAPILMAPQASLSAPKDDDFELRLDGFRTPGRDGPIDRSREYGIDRYHGCGAAGRPANRLDLSVLASNVCAPPQAVFGHDHRVEVLYLLADGRKAWVTAAYRHHPLVRDLAALVPGVKPYQASTPIPQPPLDPA